MKKIDFTKLEKRKKMYAGANGNKISVVYNDEQYMLKFPSAAKQNQNLLYSNSCFSEYIGCKIYEILEIPVQKTMLGTYNVKGKHKIVVACGDFTKPGVVLQDFASLKNQMIDSERNGYGTELLDILNTIDEQNVVDRGALLSRFWDMFVIDAFIGNWDRHNGNWGFLYDTRTDEVELAPVYDCGSSLFPQADEAIMNEVLKNDDELRFRVFEIPTSAIMLDGKKIKYFDFISATQNEDCNRAIRRITPKIDMKKIKSVIEETPYLSELQRKFYFKMLSERKNRILDFTLKLLEGEKTK